MALRHDQNIACHIFIHHVPGIIARFLESADAQPLALPQGMVHQPLVFPDHLPIDGFNGAGLGGQVAGEEVPELTFTDEA